MSSAFASALEISARYIREAQGTDMMGALKKIQKRGEQEYANYEKNNNPYTRDFAGGFVFVEMGLQTILNENKSPTAGGPISGGH